MCHVTFTLHVNGLTITSEGVMDGGGIERKSWNCNPSMSLGQFPAVLPSDFCLVPNRTKGTVLQQDFELQHTRANMNCQRLCWQYLWVNMNNSERCSESWRDWATQPSKLTLSGVLFCRLLFHSKELTVKLYKRVTVFRWNSHNAIPLPCLANAHFFSSPYPQDLLQYRRRVAQRPWWYTSLHSV